MLKARPWVNHIHVISYALYLAASILIQYALIEAFIIQGLVYMMPDLYKIILLYLIPLNVISVLLLSWIHLTKYMPMWTRAPIKGGKPAAPIMVHPSQKIPKSVLITILLFGFLSFITFVLVCPTSVYEFAANLYRNNWFFKGLIESSHQFNTSLIGSVGSLALSFRNSIWGLIRPLGETIVALDLVWKYLICQNTAAWTTAIVVLTYARYCRGRRRSAS